MKIYFMNNFSLENSFIRCSLLYPIGSSGREINHELRRACVFQNIHLSAFRNR